jgi:hypothetical protein
MSKCQNVNRHYAETSKCRTLLGCTTFYNTYIYRHLGNNILEVDILEVDFLEVGILT